MSESIPPLRHARPAAPVAPYLGGKRRLADRIIRRLADIPHMTYVEPFTGMGGVFLRRPFRAQVEVINDLSKDVTNLFRILQRHYVPLMDLLRWQLTSRSDFERLLATNAESLTDLERSARFLYLQRCAFGGKIEGRTFGISTASAGRFDVTKLGAILEAAHERLAAVTIERLPYAEVIERYDTPGTLFYLDPPYIGCETDYGQVFHERDFLRLAAQLGGIKGRFLLSINDVPAARSIFRAFKIEAVTTGYSIGLDAGSRGDRGELLITDGKPFDHPTRRLAF